MKILFLHRAKSFGGHSFEELFTTIKQHLNNCIYEDFYDKTYPSFWRNLKALKKIECDVIHITGGIGYYALFSPSHKTILTVHDTNHYEFDLKGIKKCDTDNLILAYEPVWAISGFRGKAASVNEAMGGALFVRKIFGKIFGRNLAKKIKILYGGSTSQNPHSYIYEAGMDGLIIGGSSARARDFIDLLKTV